MDEFLVLAREMKLMRQITVAIFHAYIPFETITQSTFEPNMSNYVILTRISNGKKKQQPTNTTRKTTFK